MCGVVGIFSPTTPVNDQPLLATTINMLSRISHRGSTLSSPQYFVSGGFAVGCIRLPIVDETHGHQPTLSKSGNTVLVLNGEIYNHLELKDKYLPDMTLKSGSDTEVLVNLLEIYGIEKTLPLLEGMFAFIVFDNQTREYFIARDPVGIKPIYYSCDQLTVYTASEIKAFKGTSGAIQELPPMHYYKSNHGMRKWSKEPVEIRHTLRETISNEVKMQVATDLPVAVFLSGGIDSSIICYEANKHNDNVTAYCIGTKDSMDVIMAERYCRELNFKYEHINVNTEELINTIEDTIFSIETFEPNHIRAGTLTYLISKHVSSKGYRIALCGEGADELFAGYPDFVQLLKISGDYGALSKQLDLFINELYLTQLKRVDRAGMRFGLEIRPPFLSSAVISHANSIPAYNKLALIGNKYVTKIPLREAYSGILPAYIVEREKSVFTEGAGFGTNSHNGPFWEFTKKQMEETEVQRMIDSYPDYCLKTHEEVYYFNIFRKHFDLQRIKPIRLHMSAL